MIIVKLMGGIGNQMFQYAVARRLAYIHRTELKIDVYSWFNKQSLRTYELKALHIIENIASEEEVKKFAFKRQGLTKKILGKPLEPATNYITEKFYHFDPEILMLPDGVYLDGYWQSDKYFKDIAMTLQREFTVKYPLVGRNRELAEFVQSRESVALHIRRGDYISDPKTMQFHGVCGADYYSRSVQKIEKVVREPHFIVFSDDPVWAKENLSIRYPSTIVDHNSPDKGYEDLRLMSLCRHHIIANSSFSWWGAWLNAAPNKVVIAPTRWFKSGDYNTKDLIPNTWVCL